MTAAHSLTDRQLLDFIINGYVIVKADLPDSVHADICRQAEEIFATDGNPSNAILPKIPQLAQIIEHPAVVGALTSIIGPNYLLHPHRHCHQTPPGKTAQGQHQDSYEEDANVLTIQVMRE